MRLARDTLLTATLSPQHFRIAQEATIGRLTKLAAALQLDATKLAKLRGDFEAMSAEVFADNAVHMPFLMTRANKAAQVP